MADRADEVLANLIKAQGGKVASCLDLTHDLAGGGRGVVATAACAAGTQLIVVPPSAVLSADKDVRACPRKCFKMQ